MTNASPGTLRGQIAELNRENARLQAEIGTLRQQLKEQEDEHTTFINEVLQGAPECMDGDASGESIALDYVRSLEGLGGGMSGHREECGCWS